MSDPTAFDNMKVVIEGAFYDMDLDGEILITDRNDWVNIAKMARLFTISFQLPIPSPKKITAKMELESRLENLAAELLPGARAADPPQPGEMAGCYVKVHYGLEHLNDGTLFQDIQAILVKNWGTTRKITQAAQYNPLIHTNRVRNSVTIDFQRLVSEEQLEDFGLLTQIMVSTLYELQDLIN